MTRIWNPIHNKVAIDAERRESFQTVLKTSIIVVIDILLFSLHWVKQSPKQKGFFDKLREFWE